MERGSSKHGPMHDEALEKDLQGVLGQGGGRREEWREPELPGGDRLDPEDPEEPGAGVMSDQRDPSVANDDHTDGPR